MSGNCTLKCYSCKCSCPGTGDNTSCDKCTKCKPTDTHGKKE